MLKQEDNELITRVGPGTPMGNLMREYWLPALLSQELPQSDGAPLRVMLLGEKLIAFRSTNGGVGLVADACPHRGASLFFGRNEECGLRCVYHGWKFDPSGDCVDMPNEPPESNFKDKVRTTAYPTRERGGVVWAYMGSRSVPPALPDLEANMGDNAAESVRATMVDCNWLQIIEGDIDTSHVGFLHYGGLSADDQPPGTFAEYQLRERTAHFEVIDTEGGAAYGARRPAGPDQDYWRIAQFAFPFYTFTPPGVLGNKRANACRVPVDDFHTIHYALASGIRPANTGPIPANIFGAPMPSTSDWFGRLRVEQNPTNDFLIDRGLQKQNRGPAGYSGITNLAMQDAAMTTSMGRIYDRSQEHLGAADAMVIRVRRRLIEAVRAHQEHGIAPPGVDDPTVYRVRSGGVILPRGSDWVRATHDLRRAFVEHPDLDAALNGPL